MPSTTPEGRREVPSDLVRAKREEIERAQARRRRVRGMKNRVLSALTAALSLIALFPLFSVLYMLIMRGGKLMSVTLFTDLPPGAGMPGGGIGNAIVGTLVVVGLATVLSVPFGILAAIFLAEFGGSGRYASIVRFSAKVLTGLPSIIAGVFAYALVVVTMGSFSAWAGGVALSILMLPTVILTAEDSIRMVPIRLREAAVGLGATKTQTVLRVVLPAASPGVLTGVMLAVARAMGETAPLLFTALFSDFWFRGNLHEPIASLAVLIYNFSGSPFENQIDLAWAASFVLVFIVLVINLLGQFLTRRLRHPGQ